MRAVDLLRCWEEGIDRTPVERSLLAFALARPNASVDELLDAGLGERDRELILLRCALFGAAAEAVADCPACGQRLDLSFDLRELLLPAGAPLLRVRDLVDALAAPSAFREHLMSRAGTRDATVIEEADPQASLQFDLRCAECGHDWHEPFDIGSFLWCELEDRAVRVLRDVHALASAYGWSEGEILAMPSSRRSIYLAMVGAA